MVLLIGIISVHPSSQGETYRVPLPSKVLLGLLLLLFRHVLVDVRHHRQHRDDNGCRETGHFKHLNTPGQALEPSLFAYAGSPGLGDRRPSPSHSADFHEAGLHEIAPLRDGVLGIVLEQAEEGVQLLEEHANAVGWFPGRVLRVPIQSPVLGPLGQIVDALEGALQLLSKLFIAVVHVLSLGLEIGLHQVGKLVEPIWSLIVRLVLEKFLEDGELLEVSEPVERCRVSLVDWVVCWNGLEPSVGSGSVAVLRRLTCA
ncbi:uncharacterized protein PG986_015093 [Apiospora aurea]|uniref:Secreted protein n=1 Tax=Apiospora aurea TaxID=335848 RepID=A0ABR1PRK7_9PEZI